MLCKDVVYRDVMFFFSRHNQGFEPALSSGVHYPDTLHLHTHSSKLLHVMILHLKALFEYCGQLSLIKGATHGTTTKTMVVPLFVQDGPPNSSKKAIKNSRIFGLVQNIATNYFHCKEEHTDLMPSSSS